jgi:hypothetical protein
MTLEEYYKNCVDIYLPQNKCYGIQNIKFSALSERKDGAKLIYELTLDMGPIDSGGFFIDMMNELIDSDSNIFQKMKILMFIK